MIDLHVHSYISDGSDSPKAIVKAAYEKNIHAMTLSDHDNIGGISEAEAEARKYGIAFLPGIEFSVSYGEGRLLHILGLGIDVQNETFNKIYNQLQIKREEGLGAAIEYLKKQGISIEAEEIRKHAAGKYMDRHATARCLVQKGICRNIPEAFQKYLDGIPCQKGEVLEVDEALRAIKESGGLSFLAHYTKKIGLEGYTDFEKEEHIKYLISLGLDGIERYYPTFSEDENNYADYLLSKYDLIPCGGTDFHGSNRPEVQLGGEQDGFFVSDSVYENIRTRLIERKKRYK